MTESVKYNWFLQQQNKAIRKKPSKPINSWDIVPTLPTHPKLGQKNAFISEFWAIYFIHLAKKIECITKLSAKGKNVYLNFFGDPKEAKIFKFAYFGVICYKHLFYI